ASGGNGGRDRSVALPQGGRAAGTGGCREGRGPGSGQRVAFTYRRDASGRCAGYRRGEARVRGWELAPAPAVRDRAAAAPVRRGALSRRCRCVAGGGPGIPRDLNRRTLASGRILLSR